MASTRTAGRPRNRPNSEKARTIVEAARDLGPDATNPDVADEVEDRIGDRPDPSWVSRVRSKYAADFDSKAADAPRAPVDGDVPVIGRNDVILRVDAIAGRLERYAEHVDAIEDAITDLEARVDDLEDAADRDVDDELAEAVEELTDRLRNE